MTYSQLIKNNGASTTVRALEQRCRRMAAKRGMYLNRFRSNSRVWDFQGQYYLGSVYGGGEIFPTIESVIDYLAGLDAGPTRDCAAEAEIIGELTRQLMEVTR